ncbi:MAG: carbon storage regulator CsrA [Campylobacterales bacterium]|nr:carbon storage regulator CsrA [Campylobacterales bacterium]
MLVLARKEDESIVIGKDIKIKILGIDKGGVKLGIDAPSNILILREELKNAVESANKEAVNSQNSDLDLKDIYQKIKKS